jgi:CheY-like chemotaxis protein
VAQEANRAKDEFLMTLSHELRTPMTAILGWARLLPSMSPSDPTFREAVSSIARGAQLQAHLIDDVLDVSRIVSGKMRLIRENVDVVHLLAASVEGVRPSAEAKGITIRTSLSPGLGNIIADSTRLQQVMWNLLSNAVKFTPKNGFTDMFARRTASHVQITVTDTGEGIDRDFLAHVFEPFRQAENPSTRVHGGLGLGLSIVRYIVEAHGGTVTAESRGRGTGATFTVILPISVLALSSREDSSKMADQPPLAMTTRLADVKILIVDDDRESREIVREALRQAGASVRAAESATEALAQIAGDRPDVIVTDIAMPAMDGYTFVRELRRQPESDGISIIALSAFPASSVAGEQTGFDASLTKPIDPYDLIEAIARVAGRAEESRGA